jgi:hypothetical protein
MALPHITNSEAGRNLYDPVFKNIFEVYFTLPTPLQAQFGKDTELITEHVTKLSGLGALNRAPGTGTQKFMGTDRTYINPKLDSTSAEIEVTLNLNLRNKTDNYIYKLFRAWAYLGYNQDTGERHLKKDCCADFLKISIANQAGDIYREIVFRDVMINGDLGGGHEDVDYDSTDALELTVKFKSDWWKETMV